MSTQFLSVLSTRFRRGFLSERDLRQFCTETWSSLEKRLNSFLSTWNMSTRFLNSEKNWVLVSYKAVSYKNNLCKGKTYVSSARRQGFKTRLVDCLFCLYSFIQFYFDWRKTAHSAGNSRYGSKIKHVLTNCLLSLGVKCSPWVQEVLVSNPAPTPFSAAFSNQQFCRTKRKCPGAAQKLLQTDRRK